MRSDSKVFYAQRPEPLLVVISGPSGVGKDTIVVGLKARGLPIHFVVTATTRPPRAGEVNGVDYYFYSKEQFAEMIEQDALLEYAFVYNDYKGIPKFQVRQAMESGRDVVMRLDVQGAATIRALCPEAVMIFLTTDDEDALLRRLQARRTESAAELKLRVATARKELSRIDEFDYVVVNRDGEIEQTVETIEAIITAEHHRVNQRKVTL